MSIHYSLLITGPTQYAALAEHLCSVPEYQRANGDIIAPGLLVWIGQPSQLEIEIIKEEFAFTPTVSVIFRWGREEDPVAVRTRLLRGCVALLEPSSDDAVLLFNSEIVILLRRKGKFVLNQVEGFWTDEVLAVIPAPYELESIPVL